MKTLITFFISILFISTCYAQKDLFPADSSEISFKGENAYLNNSPFNGILIDKKTNKKIGEYKEGLKN